MKIAIMSDFHLGYGKNTERSEDAFKQAKEAMQKAVQEPVSLILVSGDFFDSSTPSTETLFEAIQLLLIPKKARKADVKISKEGNELSFEGIPVIAISGTHEFRGKDFKNILSVLQEANLLFYLHGSSLPVSGDEEIEVFGLSGVPEKKAVDVFNEWKPKPVKGKKNFLLFHQSIKEFLPTDDPMSVTLGLEHLPAGFDLYIDGHLHWSNVTQFEKGKLLLPGSTVITQMKKLEAEKPKGFYAMETQTLVEKFVGLEHQRRLFYHKIDVSRETLSELKEKIRSEIKKDLSLNSAKLSPLIRLKLAGELMRGLSVSDFNAEEILKEFDGKAIFSVSKDFSSASFKQRIKELREMQESRASVSSLGMKLLEKNLSQTSFNNAFDAEQVFELLSQGEQDKALGIILSGNAEGKKGRPFPESQKKENNSSTALSDFT